MANVLNMDKQAAIIGQLAEGSSICSIKRITGVHRDTIVWLGVRIGQDCTRQMQKACAFVNKKEARNASAAQA